MRGSDGEIRGLDAATGEPIEAAFGGASAADFERACALAEAAFEPYRQAAPEATSVPANL